MSGDTALALSESDKAAHCFNVKQQISMSTNYAKYDLKVRLYKITEFIQKTAVKRSVSVVQVREELTAYCAISKGLLSMLETATKQEKKPRRLQLIQEQHMNAYFRKQLGDDDIFVMQLSLELT